MLKWPGAAPRGPQAELSVYPGSLFSAPSLPAQPKSRNLTMSVWLPGGWVGAPSMCSLPEPTFLCLTAALSFQPAVIGGSCFQSYIWYVMVKVELSVNSNMKNEQ